MKKEMQQTDKTQVLHDIFTDDPLGLLEVKQRSVAMNTDERMLSTFEEINNFYEQYKRLPEKTTGSERTLFSRLEGIKENPKKIKALLPYDRYNLLQDIQQEVEINSFDDIFGSDDLGIFDTIEEKKDIFKLINVSETNREKDRVDPDFIAHRKKCPNFEEYENLFIKCQEDLSNKKRQIIPYNEMNLIEKIMCILNGVLVYIAKVEKEERGSNGRLNRRTLLIFENGTESKMLLRSLGKRLNENGKLVSEPATKEDTLFEYITKEDQESGFIYVLQSLSNDDRIVTKRNLYKIGFSTTPVEERIKHAENDPTYLMAKVKIIETYQCFNVNPHKLEQLLHRFFGNSCLNIDIIDPKGKRYIPREWFIAPLEVIAECIELIINGEIVKYKYDDENERIVEK